MIRFLLLLCSFFLWQSADAVVTADYLNNAAKQYVLSKISIPVQDLHVDLLSLSPDLNLPDCPAISIAFENPQSEFTLGQQTLTISCQQPYWHLYLQANIYGKVPVVVSTRAILQHETLDASDVTIKEMSSKQLSEPYLTSLKNFDGTKARVYIPNMTIIRPTMLQKQYAVKRGSQVGIVLQEGQIYIRMKGIALEDGMKDDVIRVKNSSSGRVVDAQVMNSMTVKVD